MSGRRLLVTRPDGEALASRLRALGWDARAIPTVAVAPVEPGGPLDDALRRLQAYDWIALTSANAVRAVFGRLRDLDIPLPARPRWAAVGPATAAALAREGARPEVVPARYLTAEVADALGEVRGLRVLLPRADAASPDLPRILRARGALVEEVAAYRTVEGPERSREPLRRLVAEGIDAVVFTSGSTVRGFAALAGDPRAALRGALVACIGPVTAAAAAAAGLRPTVVAGEHTAEGVIAALGRSEHAQGERSR